MTFNAAELLRARAEQDPDATAVVDLREGGRQRSWRQLDEDADRVARALGGLGLVAGHRVALAVTNRVEWPALYFGILRGGMVAVPLSPRSTDQEFSRLLADSGARLVFTDERAVSAVRASGAAITSVVVGTEPKDGERSLDDFLASAPSGEPAAPRDPESLAALLYTAGPDGLPRGAMLSHRALLANLEQVGELDPPLLAPGDVVLTLVPLFHVYGLNAVLGQAVRQGVRLVLVDGFDPAGVLETVRAQGVTVLPIAPPVVAAWAGRPGLREALAGVRLVVSGSAAIDADLLQEFAESSGHEVGQGYGLTEAGPVVALGLAGSALGSVGRPVPGVEVRTVSSTGGDADPGDAGEIWIRGANLFSGYWPDRAGGPDEDGWFATGDLGFLAADGSLTPVAPLDEVISVSGFSVFPGEVEDVVGELDAVDEVAVVGLPGEGTGEVVVAFVVPAAGADTSVLDVAIAEHAAQRLARFKVPGRVIVVENLPRAANGRVSKGRLRALARGEQLGLT